MSMSAVIPARVDDVQVDLRKKTVVVTGAASGIGRAIARRFARCGATVMIDYSLEAQRIWKPAGDVFCVVWLDPDNRLYP